MRLVLPWPNAIVSPNGRGNPWKVASAKKKCREDAMWVALDGMNRTGWPRGNVVAAQVQAIFYYRPTEKRRRDRDNHQAMLKAYYDGFADAGVIRNDDGFVPLPVEFVEDKDRRVEIEVTILEQVGEDQKRVPRNRGRRG